MSRGKRSAREISEAIAANSGRSPAVVNRILQNERDFGDARDEYKGQLDAANRNNRFMRKRNGLGGSGDAQITEQDLWYIRETNRHMVDGDDLPGQMLTRLSDNIVQDTGFRLVMQTGDVGLDQEIEARHLDWASDPMQCDFYQERDFAQLQWIAQFQTEMDGDIFALSIDDGSIQLIEAERCTSLNKQSSSEYFGLQFDLEGRTIGYRFAVKPLGPYQRQVMGDTREISRLDEEGFQQVMHLRDTRRVTRHRGTPWMLPVMIKAGMLDDLQFATVVKAQSAAAHAGVIEQSDSSMGGAPPSFGARTTQTTTAADGSAASQFNDAVRYGSYTMLPKGMKLNGFTPPIPNAEHFQHVRGIIQQMGAGIGMPVELVLLDASSTNYSGWRGVMDAARMGFRRWQKNLTSQFHRPILRLNVRRWAYDMGPVARRALADKTIFQHKWVPPSWAYINPKDDAEAAKLLLASGQESPRSLLAKKGDSFDDVLRETLEDRDKAIRSAIERCQAIEKDLGERISPFVFLGWDLPGNSALITSADEMVNAPAGDVAADPVPAPGVPAESAP